MPGSLKSRAISDPRRCASTQRRDTTLAPKVAYKSTHGAPAIFTIIPTTLKFKMENCNILSITSGNVGLYTIIAALIKRTAHGLKTPIIPARRKITPGVAGYVSGAQRRAFSWRFALYLSASRHYLDSPHIAYFYFGTQSYHITRQALFRRYDRVPFSLSATTSGLSGSRVIIFIIYALLVARTYRL